MKRIIGKIASIVLITALTISMVPTTWVNAATTKEVNALSSYKSYLKKTAESSSSTRTYGFYIMDLDDNGVPELYCDTDKSDYVKLSVVLYKKGKNKRIYKSSESVDAYYYSSSNSCIMSQKTTTTDSTSVTTYVIYKYKKSEFKEVKKIVMTNTNGTLSYADGDGNSLTSDQAKVLIDAYMVDAVALDFIKNNKKNRKKNVLVNVASSMADAFEFIPSTTE